MKNALLLAGLGYGDEGKGASSDYICRTKGTTLIVKYNGGPQNYHVVTKPDGVSHGFRQFGAGSFLPGVETYISRYALINPLSMIIEAGRVAKIGVKNILDRTYIDGGAVVITPFQKVLNQYMEVFRGSGSHGSCGVGLGQARADSLAFPDQVLRVRHLGNRSATEERLRFIEMLHRPMVQYIHDNCHKELSALGLTEYVDLFNNPMIIQHTWEEYCKLPAKCIVTGTPDFIFDAHDNVLFEGSQGVGLDEKHGTQPHTTWTNTTFGNAHKILEDFEPPKILLKIGIVRSYATRHGKGPLYGEGHCPYLEDIQEEHNKANEFQGDFRKSHLDLRLIKKSIGLLEGLDQIYLNHMDQFCKMGVGFTYDNDDTMSAFMDTDYHESQMAFADHLEEELSTPVTVLGYGPRSTDRLERIPNKL